MQIWATFCVEVRDYNTVVAVKEYVQGDDLDLLQEIPPNLAFKF
jgi:hypothetical protein